MAKRHTLPELYQYQALSLNAKIAMTRSRVREWIETYGEDGVYISFSGGKDSTVLLDLVRNRFGYKNVPAVFFDVPTQFPELRQFAEKFENVEIVKPKISFMEVCERYGFPMLSKEISECVQGARKYLTSIMQEGTLDRPTDRPTDRRHPYRYWYERVCGQGKYAKSEWGYDNKYRKLRGLGEYSKRTDADTGRRLKSETSDNVRNANKESGDKDAGEYP